MKKGQMTRNYRSYTAFAVVLVVAALYLALSRATRSQCAIPDMSLEVERRLSYKTGFYSLENKADWKYPYGAYSICVDKNGIGHLQSQCTDSKRFPRKKIAKTNNLVIIDWELRTSFLKPEVGWTPLSEKDAIEFWGDFRRHKIGEEEYLSFDAKNVHAGEPNIFHLDLKFEKSNPHLLKEYRVRGIGVSNPSWVSPLDGQRNKLVLSEKTIEPAKKEEPEGSIVYTVKPISARTKLAKDMFREEWVPQAQIPQAAVSRIFQLDGRIAQYDLPKGCVVSTPFASGLYAPKGDVDYRDPIPCIYDTSTNSWSIKESVKITGKKAKPDRDSVRKYIKGLKDSNSYEATDCSTKPKVTKLGPGQLKGI